MKITGTYVFKQNGEEIGRSQNIITANGTRAILQYLTGASQEWASAIAVGAIPTTASSADMTLEYEIARSAVTMKSYKYGFPNLIIVKGTLSSEVSANIYEVGVYPYNTGQIFGRRDQLIIDDFSYSYNWLFSKISGSTVSAIPANSNSSYYNNFAAQSVYSPRVGTYSLNIPANSTISNSNLSVNLSSYTSLNTFDILVNVAAGSAGTMTVTLTDVNGNTTSSPLSYSFDASILSGYQILSTNLPSDIISLSSINNIAINTSGTNSSITLDAMRISLLSEIGDLSGLVSRSVLTTPIAKIYGTPLDIEYYVQIG